MKKTPEERAETSRANGRKSKGPKTPEGKRRASMNAFKHGMRAEVLAMANEDPEVVAARTASWNDYYQPRSPAAQHLTDRCLRATFLADRCDRSHDAILGEQVDDAAIDWDEDRHAEVAEDWAGLAAHPAATIQHLQENGHGCRWLIARWERLLRRLDLR